MSKLSVDRADLKASLWQQLMLVVDAFLAAEHVLEALQRLQWIAEMSQANTFHKCEVRVVVQAPQWILCFTQLSVNVVSETLGFLTFITSKFQKFFLDAIHERRDNFLFAAHHVEKIPSVGEFLEFLTIFVVIQLIDSVHHS